MSLFLNLHNNDPRQPRRFWKYWPIRFGWDSYEIPESFFSWEAWPLDGPSIWADTPYLEYGWTIHIGAFKIHFGE